MCAKYSGNPRVLVSLLKDPFIFAMSVSRLFSGETLARGMSFLEHQGIHAKEEEMDIDEQIKAPHHDKCWIDA